MKRKLLTILLLMTGFVYLLSVLELDSNEYKQNYAKENHTYISCAKTTGNFNFHSVKIFDLPVTFSNNYFQCYLEQVTVKISLYPDHSPPDKIFLSYLSLQI